MYSVGLFYAWDFLGWIIMTIAYVYSSASVLREKNEYCAFFLKFFSFAFTLFVIIMNVLTNTELTHILFWITICPLLFIFHQVFPFKKIKRSQHLSFFLFFISGFVLAIKGFTLVVYMLSPM
jgi:hypothetical protein